MSKTFSCFLLASLWAAGCGTALAVEAEAAPPQELSKLCPDFHIGNSLTVDAQVRPQEPGVDSILATLGVDRPCPGWQLASGTGLYRHFTFTSNTGTPLVPSTNAAYGCWDRAFAEVRFHAVTLQPWSDGSTCSRERAGLVGLIRALRASPLNQKTKIFFYTAIPNTPERQYPVTSATTFAQVWNSPLPSDTDKSAWQPSKAGVDWLIEQARQGTGETLRRVPLGDVLAALDAKLRAQSVAGFKTGWDLYRDRTHLNASGSYVAALTMAAALYDKDPRATGLGKRFKNIDPAFAAIVKEVVYQSLGADEKMKPE
jgi:hypothetical protein